jgi:hypothetical protein
MLPTTLHLRSSSAHDETDSHRSLRLLLLMMTSVSLLLQGKRAALRSSTLMIRQPLQRLSGMQASDIDIYRRVTREKTATMVRLGSSSSGADADTCSVVEGRGGDA